MPCYRCGTRQSDPDRGESLWARGVRDESQVLICPGCQDGREWTGELDRCGVCSGVRLVRRLGETECRDCGAVGPGRPPGASSGSAVGGAGVDGPAVPGLAGEVERALARVLGRPSRPAPIR